MLSGTTIIVEIDADSRALADTPLNNSKTQAARADLSSVALTTLYNRYCRQPIEKETA